MWIVVVGFSESVQVVVSCVAEFDCLPETFNLTLRCVEPSWQSSQVRARCSSSSSSPCNIASDFVQAFDSILRRRVHGGELVTTFLRRDSSQSSRELAINRLL